MPGAYRSFPPVNADQRRRRRRRRCGLAETGSFSAADVHLRLRLFPYAAGNVPATILRRRATPCENRCLAHPRAAVVRAARGAHVAVPVRERRGGGSGVRREEPPRVPALAPQEPFAAALSAVARASGEMRFLTPKEEYFRVRCLSRTKARCSRKERSASEGFTARGGSGNPAFPGDSSRLVVDAARRVAEKAAALDADANANADANAVARAVGVSNPGFQTRALPPAVSAAAADALRGVVVDLLRVVPRAAVPAAAAASPGGSRGRGGGRRPARARGGAPRTIGCARRLAALAEDARKGQSVRGR